MLTTVGNDRVCEVAYLTKLVHNPDQYKIVLTENDVMLNYGNELIHIPDHSVIFLPPEENPEIDEATGLRVVYFSQKFWCRSLTQEMIYNDVHGLPQPVMTDDIGGVLRCINPFYRRDTHPHGVVTPPLLVYDLIFGYVNEIEKQLTKQDNWEWSCRARSSLSSIMETIIDLDFGAEPSYLSLAQKTVAYLHNNLENTFTLQDVADYLGVSKDVLSKSFKGAYNSSVMQYAINCRMRKAHHDLAMTSIPVEEIAQSVGYSSASHFTKSYVKLYGETPTQYRDRCVAKRKALFNGGNPC